MATTLNTAANRRRILANAHARYFSAAGQGMEEDLKLGGSMVKEDSVTTIVREGTTLIITTAHGLHFTLDAYGNTAHGEAA